MEKIFDPVRKKYVALTPEERVRQGMIAALADRFGVPITHIASEYAMNFNGLSYRADIVVFNRALSPVMLVECKAPTVALTEAVAAQVIRYNLVLKTPFILLTNGLEHRLFNWSETENDYVAATQMPDYETMCKWR